MKKFLQILTLLSFICVSSLHSQVMIGDTEVDTTSVLMGLDTPWEIRWGPDDEIWLTERFGRVSRFNPETGEHTVLLNINAVHEQSESGLLGMAFHPDFPETAYVYLVYNYREDSRIKERLVRYSYTGSALENEEILMGDIGGSGNHNGSRLEFGPDGKLYMTTGDAVDASLSQDPESLNGKILRINPDGSIPDDNPFDNSYVYTLGHRNPQGLVFAPSGILYSSEHGPASDDELNIIEEGRNYGWPDVKGFCDGATETDFCNQNNVKEPLIAWTPTLAVAGIDYYDDPAIPEWQNSILMTTLKESELRVMPLSGDGSEVTEDIRYFDNWWGRLRDVCVSPDGRVFIATSNRDGRGDVSPGDDRIIEIRAVEDPTGSSSPKEEDFHVYPNPVSGDYIHIFSQSLDKKTSIRIYDISGKLMKSINPENGEGHVKIPFPYQEGIYFLELENPEGKDSGIILKK